MQKSAFALYLYLILLTKGLVASDGYIYGIPQTLLLVLTAIVSVIVYKIYSYYRTLRINKSYSEILRKRSSVAPVKKELLQDDSKDITDEIYEHVDKKSVYVELKMDGYTATSTIRSDDRSVDLPIVALTTLVLDSEVDKMLKHGVSGYLSKPLEIGRPYSAFEFFLDKNTKGAELPVANKQIKTKEIDAIDTLPRDLVDDQNYNHIKMLCSDMRSLTKSIGAYKMHVVADRMYKLFLYNYDHMIPKYAEEYGRELEKLKSSIEIHKERYF